MKKQIKNPLREARLKEGLTQQEFAQLLKQEGLLGSELRQAVRQIEKQTGFQRICMQLAVLGYELKLVKSE